MTTGISSNWFGSFGGSSALLEQLFQSLFSGSSASTGLSEPTFSNPLDSLSSLFGQFNSQKNLRNLFSGSLGSTQASHSSHHSFLDSLKGAWGSASGFVSNEWNGALNKGSAAGTKVVNFAQNFVGETRGTLFSVGHKAEKWCMDFASYATGIPHQSSCQEAQHWAQRQGKWHSLGSGYTPKAGDIVLYNWHRDGIADHAGIVKGASASGISTIEGNTNIGRGVNGVGEKHRPWNNQILGFISVDGAHAA